MKKIIILFALTFLILVACESAEEKSIREERNNFDMHENIDGLLGIDAMYVVWKIQDEFIEKEEVDPSTLFNFTDTYLMEDFDTLNEQEQAIVMKTSGMISKFLGGRYNNKDDFNKDKDDFYKVLESGIN